jgi:hypothetical protein
MEAGYSALVHCYEATGIPIMRVRVRVRVRVRYSFK